MYVISVLLSEDVKYVLVDNRLVHDPCVQVKLVLERILV